jgi:hypothetical protein
MRCAEARTLPFIFSIAVLCVLAACGGSGSSRSSGGGSDNNVQPIVVNSGPMGNYANGVFTTVNVCAPGTTNCQSISGVLVDTGSFGLRILSSALTVPLTQQNDANGNPVVECAQFALGITWGPVRIADVNMAGETASALPIQVVGDTTVPNPPSSCTKNGAPQDSLKSLGANGILGVGNFIEDCGPACAPGTTKNPGFYYACAGSSCQVITLDTGQQAQNPVAFFSSDNNGVIVDLPAATGNLPSLNGSLIFGIGTQSNNSLGNAQVLTVDNFGNITTTFMGKAYTSSFIDSGSNGYFFLDASTTGIPTCPNPNSGFYCPASPVNLSATNSGTNGSSNTVSFTIDNANTLFSDATASVFPNLGGPNSGTFDWGLPFFFGRKVYAAIEMRNTPGGPGPYWAY